MKNLYFKLSVSIMFIAIIAWGCTKDSISNKSKPAKTYTGKEYFDGIFFLRGDFGQQVPIIKSLDIYHDASPENVKIIFAFQDKIDSIINIIDPTYFGDLSTVVKSHTRSDIDREMNRGGINILKALNTIPSVHDYFEKNPNDPVFSSYGDNRTLRDVLNLDENNMPALKINSPEPVHKDMCAAVTYVFYFVAVAHNTAAVTVNVGVGANAIAAIAIAIWKYKYFWSELAPNPPLVPGPGVDPPTDPHPLVPTQTDLASLNLNKFKGLQYDDLVNQIGSMK